MTIVILSYPTAAQTIVISFLPEMETMVIFSGLLAFPYINYGDSFTRPWFLIYQKPQGLPYIYYHQWLKWLFHVSWHFYIDYNDSLISPGIHMCSVFLASEKLFSYALQLQVQCVRTMWSYNLIYPSFQNCVYGQIEMAAVQLERHAFRRFTTFDHLFLNAYFSLHFCIYR